MKGEEELILAVMRLRGAAPGDWESFVAIMRKLAAIKASELVRATPDMLQTAQGFARAYEEIAMALVDAPAKFERAQQNGRVQTQSRP